MEKKERYNMKKLLTRLFAIVLTFVLVLGDGNVMQVLADSYLDFETEKDSAADDPDVSSKQWYHGVLGTPRIWYQMSTGRGVKVAVISTGYTAHDEMEGSVLTTNFASGDNADADGRGTAMCGIIGAKRNGNLGCGIAPDAQIYSYRVAPYGYGENMTGGNELSLYNAITQAYLYDEVDIVCIDGIQYDDNEYVEKAILEAYESGVLVVCAAGDHNSNAVTYPASYKGAVSVAALNEGMTKAATSNYGTKVRYAAPGVGFEVLTTNNGVSITRDEEGNSSSYAAAIVAGQAALLWNQAEGDGSKKKVDNLLKLMDKNCTRVNGSGMGKGYINVPKAFGMKDTSLKPDKPVVLTPGGVYEGDSLDVYFDGPNEPNYAIFYSLDGKPITMKDGILSDNAYFHSVDKEEPLWLQYGMSYTYGTGKGKITLHVAYVVGYRMEVGANTKVVYTLKPKAEEMSVYLNSPSAGVVPGSKISYVTEFRPYPDVTEKVTWSVTSDAKGYQKGMAKISSTGVVTTTRNAVPGTYTVTAVSESGLTAYNSFNVINAESYYDAVAKSVKMPKKNYVLCPNDEILLEGSVVNAVGETTLYDGLRWSTEDSYCAKVDFPGKLVAKKPGKVKIHGYCPVSNKKMVTINVTVKQPVERINVTGNDYIYPGGSATYKASVLPANAANKKVRWSVFPEGEGVTIHPSTGRVTVDKTAQPGKTYQVKATASDGSNISEYKNFTIADGRKTTKLTTSTKSLDVFRLSTGYGVDASGSFEVMSDTDYWAVSYDPYKVSVYRSGNTIKVSSNGYASVGTTTVTVYTTDGSNKKATVRVNLKNRPTGLMIAPEANRSGNLAEGCSLKMNAYFLTGHGKVDAKCKKLIWKSSNPEAAKVDANGKVTAQPGWSGRVQITAETADGSGLYAGYTIALEEKVKKIELCDVNGTPIESKMELKAGSGNQYKIKTDNVVYPWNHAENFDVKVSKEGLRVFFDRTGNVSADYNKICVYAEKPGTYTVTFGLLNGSKVKKSYTFVVK